MSDLCWQCCESVGKDAFRFREDGGPDSVWCHKCIAALPLEEIERMENVARLAGTTQTAGSIE